MLSGPGGWPLLYWVAQQRNLLWWEVGGQEGLHAISRGTLPPLKEPPSLDFHAGDCFTLNLRSTFRPELRLHDRWLCWVMGITARHRWVGGIGWAASVGGRHRWVVGINERPHTVLGWAAYPLPRTPGWVQLLTSSLWSSRGWPCVPRAPCSASICGGSGFPASALTPGHGAHKQQAGTFLRIFPPPTPG